jgi:raffinose/stachyose/melibiose transport system substrate-binding protein
MRTPTFPCPWQRYHFEAGSSVDALNPCTVQKHDRKKVMLGNWLRGFIAAAAVASAPAAVCAQEIKFWTLSFDNPAVTKAYETIIKNFEAANPGVTIKLENRGTDEHKSALRVAAGSDQAPDIYFMWAGLGLGGEFIKSGLALPMDKYYSQYKWDDEFIGPALSFSKQYPGGRFGIPSTFRGEAIYYNKALFEKAGVTSEPKTYEELVAAADKLAAANPRLHVRRNSQLARHAVDGRDPRSRMWSGKT